MISIFTAPRGACAIDRAWDHDFAAEIGKHSRPLPKAKSPPLTKLAIKRVPIGKRARPLPSSCKEMYASYCDQGWPGLTAPEEFGGQAQDALTLAVSEIYSSANHSMQMVTGLVPGAIRTLLNFGTDAQKDRFLPSLPLAKRLRPCV